MGDLEASESELRECLTLHGDNEMSSGVTIRRQWIKKKVSVTPWYAQGFYKQVLQ